MTFQDIYLDIYPLKSIKDILSGIYSEILWHSIRHLFSHSTCLAFYLTYILAFYLTYSMAFSLANILRHSIYHLVRHSIWHVVWHSIWQIFYEYKMPGLTLYLTYILRTVLRRVEVQRCPLRSRAASWGPAVTSARAASWGPAVQTTIEIWQGGRTRTRTRRRRRRRKHLW